MEYEEFYNIVKPYEATHLYKYRSMNTHGLDQIFINNQIYLSDPTTFNDPFECRPNLTFHKSQLKREQYLEEIINKQNPNVDKRKRKKLLKSKRAKNSLTDPKHLEQFYLNFIKTNGVYCLSEKNDDILMWAHYADSHKGFCIEFDASKKDTLFWEALKVGYQEEYPKVNIMEMGTPQEFRKALLTKSSHWIYEQERRIIKTKGEGGPGKYAFPAKLITGLIFGAFMTESDKRKIEDWLSNFSHKIKIYEARLNKYKYQLDILPI